MRKLKPEEMKFVSSYNHRRQHSGFLKYSAKSKGNKEVRGCIEPSGPAVKSVLESQNITSTS